MNMQDKDSHAPPDDLLRDSRICEDLTTSWLTYGGVLWVPFDTAARLLEEARILSRDLWDLAASCAAVSDLDIAKLTVSMPKWMHDQNPNHENNEHAGQE